MQTFTLIPSLGMNSEDFWNESNKLARENNMDKNLAWMYLLVSKSKEKRLSIRRDHFRNVGSEVILYNGVDTWFERMNAYALDRSVTLEHYIISSGLAEIIEGSKISHNFTKIYASSYLYSPDGVVEWPAQVVNYTTKTQFLFRIAKGILDEYDDGVNDYIPDDSLHIPYDNIIYIGDSATDIPCMRLVKSRGGISIGVYGSQTDGKNRVRKLFHDGRINFYTPADYCEGSELESIMTDVIDEICAKEKLRTRKLINGFEAQTYSLGQEARRFAEATGANDETLEEFEQLINEMLKEK